MKLTSNDALNLLREANRRKKSDGWIEHSISVGKVAGKIASKIPGLDSETAEAMGYIHDIGKMTGTCSTHILEGYELLKEKGYDDKYCMICITHSYLNGDTSCVAGKEWPVDDEVKMLIKDYKYTEYDKLINLADLMCTEEIATMEYRLEDLAKRKGTCANTSYHNKEAMKLKEYFDRRVGQNIYDLFPGVESKYDINMIKM